MSIDKLFIYNSINDNDYYTGSLYINEQTVYFEYAEEWLNNPLAFALNNNCPLDIIPKKITLNDNLNKSKSYLMHRLVDCYDFYYPIFLLFLRKKGFIEESSFDLSKLYDLFEHKGESIFEGGNLIPFLINLAYQNDYTRTGSLRIKLNKEDDFFMNDSSLIPSYNEVDNVISIVNKIINKTETAQELDQFAACASNLAGGKPKINVFDENKNLCIAKIGSYQTNFESNYDDLPFKIELLALKLAQKFKINTQEYSIQETINFKYLLLKRFDRIKQKRIPMLHFHDYMENNDTNIIGIICKICKDNYKVSLKEFFRRQLFCMCVGDSIFELIWNTSFLMKDNVWVISPAYDVGVRYSLGIEKEETLAVVEDNIQKFISNAFLYEIDNDELNEILYDLKVALKDWQQEAISVGFKEDELSRIRIYEEVLYKLNI